MSTYPVPVSLKAICGCLNEEVLSLHHTSHPSVVFPVKLEQALVCSANLDLGVLEGGLVGIDRIDPNLGLRHGDYSFEVEAVLASKLRIGFSLEVACRSSWSTIWRTSLRV
jgi:hypothetical protein